jgi:hypothetical protein
LLPLMALSWRNLPCALKADIGTDKRTVGGLASLPRHRGRSKVSAWVGAPVLASEHARHDRHHHRQPRLSTLPRLPGGFMASRR